MKKRLRKKLRLREFQEMGFHVDFDLNLPDTDEASFAFWDKLIAMVEGNKLQIGGGLTSFFTCGLPRRTSTEADREALTTWLRQQPEIANIRVGPLVDVWYGPFE